MRDFGPVFEFHDLQVTQRDLFNDVYDLQYTTRVEKIKNAVMSAQLQLLIRNDYVAADVILTNARQTLDGLIDSLPVEKKVEPKRILNNIERVIDEIRQGPSKFDEKFREVLVGLEKM